MNYRVNMNPNFTEATFSRFNFVMDIFYTDPARKFGIIGINHKTASFCLLHFSVSKNQWINNWYKTTKS